MTKQSQTRLCLPEKYTFVQQVKRKQIFTTPLWVPNMIYLSQTEIRTRGPDTVTGRDVGSSPLSPSTPHPCPSPTPHSPHVTPTTGDSGTHTGARNTSRGE